MHSPTATYAADGRTADSVIDVLRGAGLVVGAQRNVVRTSLDTFDGLLFAAGLRLTVHDDGTRRTVALTGSGVVGVQTVVTADPVWPTDLPAGPMRARVAAAVDVRALQPVMRITATEREVVRYDGRRKAVLQATLIDGATVEPGGGPLGQGPLIEVAPLAGYPKPAEDLHDALTTAGITALDVDAIGLAGVDMAGYSSSPTVPLDASMPALDGWCAVLANLAATARANWAGTLAQVDTEFLHELRVAVRRSRSILGHGKGVVPADVLEPTSRLLAEVGTATGPARDFDVQLLGFPAQVRRLGTAAASDLDPVHALLTSRHQLAHASLDAELAAPAVLAGLDAWQAWLADPTHPGDRSSAPLADAPLGAVVAKRIRKAHDRVIDDGRAISPDSEAESLHDLRKQAKKLRYLLECFASLLPGTERKEFVRALKGLQDNLGEHQDAAVHVEELRAVGDDVHRSGAPAATMFALGELSALIDGQRALARDEFAERFAAFDTKETRRALKAMLAGLDPVKILATYSIKGGVGKTTAAVNLAHEAAAQGARVLLWDIDPQGAATFFFRIRPVVKGGAGKLIDKGALDGHIRATDLPGLHVVPADFSMRHLDLHLDDAKHPRRRLGALLEPLADDYDVALIDCPAGITLASEGVFAAADVLIVPTIPTTLSKRTLDQLTEHLAAHPPAPLVVPFISMYDRRKRLQRELVAELNAGTPKPLPTTIPNSSIVERMGIERAPIGSYSPKSVAAAAFRQLWADVAELLW